MNQIKLIYKNNPLYPKKFLKLKQPPDILFAIGNLNLLNSFSIAIVGARNATLNSQLLTKDLSKELTNRNITIISGMATGIDSIAHEACLEVKGNTIAILGNGFDISRRQKIFNKILINNGLILSEYFPDIPALKYHFPRRNELITALSDGVVAVEVHEKSGTLITAKKALSHGKPLFTFPGDVNDNNYKGNNFLLTNGAKCILSYKDIIKYYPDKNFKIKSIGAKLNVPEEYLDIYSALSKFPQSINTLSTTLNQPLQELQYKLMLMELENLAIKLPNNCYIKQ